MKFFGILALAFSIFAPNLDCGPSSPPINPTPTPVTPTDVDDCKAACEKMQSLHCPQGEDVAGPNGTWVTCQVFCERSLKDNNVPLNPSCVKTITACNQIETTCAVGRNRF